MLRWFVPVALLVGCPSVVRGEGFGATVSGADESSYNGRYRVEGPPSCGVAGPRERELRLRDERFELDLVEKVSPSPSRVVTLTIDGERFTTERTGGSSRLVLDTPSGRLIGSLSAHLIHESAGTQIDGRPAPVRALDLDLTFNLQPCL